MARVVGLKPDVVFTAAAGSAAVAVYRAFQQQGFPADKIVNTGATVDEETFFSKIDKPAVEGSFYSYEFETYDDTSNPEVKEYRDAMKEHSDVDGKSEFYQWGFADVMTVYNLGKKIGGDKLNAEVVPRLHEEHRGREGLHGRRAVQEVGARGPRRRSSSRRSASSSTRAARSSPCPTGSSTRSRGS